jgi:hypothetical protein
VIAFDLVLVFVYDPLRLYFGTPLEPRRRCADYRPLRKARRCQVQKEGGRVEPKNVRNSRFIYNALLTPHWLYATTCICMPVKFQHNHVCHRFSVLLRICRRAQIREKRMNAYDGEGHRLGLSFFLSFSRDALESLSWNTVLGRHMCAVRTRFRSGNLPSRTWLLRTRSFKFELHFKLVGTYPYSQWHFRQLFSLLWLSLSLRRLPKKSS